MAFGDADVIMNDPRLTTDRARHRQHRWLGIVLSMACVSCGRPSLVKEAVSPSGDYAARVLVYQSNGMLVSEAFAVVVGSTHNGGAASCVFRAKHTSAPDIIWIGREVLAVSYDDDASVYGFKNWVSVRRRDGSMSRVQVRLRPRFQR